MRHHLWNCIFSDSGVRCTVVKKDNVGVLHLANNGATILTLNTSVLVTTSFGSVLQEIEVD